MASIPPQWKTEVSETNRILYMLRELAASVSKTIRYMVQTMDAYSSNKFDDVQTLYNKTREAKEEADAKKAGILNEIASISGYVELKASLLELIRAVHKAVDFAEGAAARAALLSTRKLKCCKSLADKIKDIGECLIACAEELKIAIMDTTVNVNNVSSHVQQILKLERKVDQLYREASILLIDQEDVDIRAYILLLDILTMMEETCDAIENAAENIHFYAIERT